MQDTRKGIREVRVRGGQAELGGREGESGRGESDESDRLWEIVSE